MSASHHGGVVRADIVSVFAAIAAAFCFACMGAFVKATAHALPFEWVVFGRSLFGLVFIIPVILICKTPLSTKQWPYHFSRGLIGLAAMYCYFFALQKLPLAEAVLLNYTTPLFTPFVAYVWLRERVATPVKFAIMVGFAGVMLVLKPAGDFFSGAAVVGLFSGALAAAAMVNIRKLSATEPVLRIVFYFSLIACVVSALPLATTASHGPNAQQWLVLVGAGFFANLGQLCLTVAYANAPAARVAPYTYSAVLFAALLGWFLWQESLDLYTLLGAMLIVVAGWVVL
jgi:drug/metabolite transporter (DMT)-like permease